MADDQLEAICRHHTVDNNQRQLLLEAEKELRQIYEFFQRAEATAVQGKDSVNYKLIDNGLVDWYSAGDRSQGHYFFSTTSSNSTDLNMLRAYIHRLYELRIPTFMAELLTKEFKFFLDIQVQFSDFDNKSIDLSPFYHEDSEFVKTVGECVFKMFPDEAKKACDVENVKSALKVMVSKTERIGERKPVKLCVRLTFLKIVVDEANASKMRNYICNQLREKAETDASSSLNSILSECIACHSGDNSAWECLIQKRYAVGNRLLLNYCDYGGTFEGRGAGTPLVPSHGLQMTTNENGVHIRRSDKVFKPEEFGPVLSVLKKNGETLSRYAPPEEVKKNTNLPPVDAAAEKKRNRVHRPMPGYD